MTDFDLHDAMYFSILFSDSNMGEFKIPRGDRQLCATGVHKIRVIPPRRLGSETEIKEARQLLNDWGANYQCQSKLLPLRKFRTGQASYNVDPEFCVSRQS